MRIFIYHIILIDFESKENFSNAIDESKPTPLRASKRRASQESSGSNGSSKEAKRMLYTF